MNRSCLKAVCLFGSTLLCTLAFAAGPGYHVIKKIKVGGEGGWDCLRVDSVARRLYVSRGTHVEVVDVDSDKVVGDIPDTQGVHDIALAPEYNRGFISCGKTNSVAIFDLKTLKVVGSVPAGTNPDIMLYDPTSKKVFSFNGRSKDSTVIDSASGLVVSTITLGGRPEFANADGKGKIYVNIENTSEVVEIDSQKLIITKRFCLNPARNPQAWDWMLSTTGSFQGVATKL